MTSSLRIVTALTAVALAACSSSPQGGTSAAASGLCPPSASKADLPGIPGLPGVPTSPAPTGAGGGLTQVTSFGDNPGGLEMYVHAPPSASGKATAVVVAMHGCTQGATDYVNAGWNALADAGGFAVVYPQQTSANNFQKCFRWFDKAHITRGAGEARSIAAMAEYAKTHYGASHVFVTGLSAGAAMTAVMLATYPDIFEAGAVMSGLPYACATSQTDAYGCMNPGKDQTAAAWAALVPSVSGASAPRVSIWHGDTDYTVAPMNETQLARQFAGLAGAETTPSVTSTESNATHAEYKDASGVTQVETWLVKGMSHGVALAPKAGCGTASAYMLDEGLCSTTKAAQFFGLVAPDGRPTTPNGPGASPGTSGTSGEGGGAAGPCP